jgi:hypothetical protein
LFAEVAITIAILWATSTVFVIVDHEYVCNRYRATVITGGSPYWEKCFAGKSKLFANVANFGTLAFTDCVVVSPTVLGVANRVFTHGWKRPTNPRNVFPLLAMSIN